MSSSPVSLFDSPKLQTAYLIVSAGPLSSAKTYVFSIDKNTGGIYHAGIPNVDIFSNQESASQYLSSLYSDKKVGNSQSNFKSLGKSLIGATIYQEKDTLKKYLVIICVQNHEEITSLFNQPIYKILEVSYTFFELNSKSVLSSSSSPHVYFSSYAQLLKSNQVSDKNSFLNFDLRNNHFYCPTLDMNSHFPYPENVISIGSFCWNKRFLIPFEENNCLKACITVLQGGVYTYKQESTSITYVVKRSSMFPGTRYNARGLKVTSSKTVEPANECECELIFSDGEFYYSQTWRRGSPPVFWRTESGLLTASHFLSANPSEMTPMYFYQHIIKRFHPSKVHIVSLLSSKEKSFNDAYEQGARKVLFTTSNSNDENNENVDFTFSRFDINSLLSSHDTPNTNSIASKFFEMFENDVDCSNFTKVRIDTGKIEGSEEDELYTTLTLSRSNQNDNDESLTSPNQTVKKLNFDLIPINTPNQQSVVFRFNCADSLDRTNVGTFFYSLILTSKFAFQKKVESFLSESANQAQQSDDLWKNPLSYLNQQVIDFLIDSFVISGNVISQLYTNTKAIKSQVIKKTQAVGEPVTTSNYSPLIWRIDDLLTSFTRRYKNTFSDKIRQHTIEEWTRTFSIKNPRFVLDQQHIAFCYSQINGESKENDKVDHSIFEITEKDFVLKSAKDITAMFPEPLFLYQISFLVFRRNIDENVTITLQVGNDNRGSSIFFKDLLVPIINDKNASRNKDGDDCYVWVTYNLRKIAKYSNLFPIEPESLRPALFVNVRFECPNKQITQWKRNFRIGNIKFVVKKPSFAIFNQIINFSDLTPQEASNMMLRVDQKNNAIDHSTDISKHKYILTGKPVSVNGVHLEDRIKIIYDKTFSSFKNYFDNSKNAPVKGGTFLHKLIRNNNSSDHLDLSSLPEMGELMLLMMRWIKYGISDFNRFSEMVKHKANPWVFDLSSRMHSQTDINICPFCGKKTKAEAIIEKLSSLKEEHNNNNNNNNDSNSNSKNSDDRELLRKSTVYMPNPVFPLFYIKTINQDLILNDQSNVTFLCEECSKYYDDLISHENKKCKSKPNNKMNLNLQEKNDNESFEDDADYENENDLGDAGNEDEDDLTAQSSIISNHIGNFVNISDISNVQQSFIPAFFNSNFCHFDDIPVPLNLNEMARIYDSPSRTPSRLLTSALYASFLPQPNNADSCAHLVGNFAEFSVCFVAPVNPTELKFLLNEPLKTQFELIVNIHGFKDNVAFLKDPENASKNSKQLCYEIRLPKNKNGDAKCIQSMIFKFFPVPKSTELDIMIKMINITGFIEKRGRNDINNLNDDDENNNIYIVNYDNSNSNGNITGDNDDVDLSNRKKEVVQLPKFQQTKNGEWNICLRNQSFHAPQSFPVNFKVSGIAISIPQNKSDTAIHSLIFAFYRKNTLVHKLPIILPSDFSEIRYIDRENKNQNQGHGVWLSSLFSLNQTPQMDCFYFPISNTVYNRFDFDNVSVFYIGRTTSVTPLNIMFV